jgi:hypothetical protein
MVLSLNMFKLVIISQFGLPYMYSAVSIPFSVISPGEVKFSFAVGAFFLGYCRSR